LVADVVNTLCSRFEEGSHHRNRALISAGHHEQFPCRSSLRSAENRRGNVPASTLRMFGLEATSKGRLIVAMLICVWPCETLKARRYPAEH
jgi:hypothetical protein